MTGERLIEGRFQLGQVDYSKAVPARYCPHCGAYEGLCSEDRERRGRYVGTFCAVTGLLMAAPMPEDT